MRIGWPLGLAWLFGPRRRARTARRRERPFRRLTVERLEDRSLLAATLVGTVWQDLNSDGQQTGGEPAVQYAVAELFSSTNGTIGDSDDVSLGTRITDAAGNYQFTGLAAGVNHFVVVRPPVGFAFTVQDTGPDATDSDVSATGVSAMFAPVDLSTVDLDAGLTGAVPAFGWAARQGASSYDQNESIVVDAAGTSYVAGSFVNTVDFDPGPGTVNLTSGGGTDAYVAKFTAGGALVWARRAAGWSNDEGLGVAVDSGGNVLVTGYFQGYVDFDPGPGTLLRFVVGAEDLFVWKLSSEGNLVWAAQVGGTAYVNGTDVAVDSSDNVLVAGYFSGTADFDPGAGTLNLTSAGSRDVLALKLDSAGQLVWAARAGGTSADNGYGVAVDAADAVIVTGFFQATADFDPGAGTVNLTSAGVSDVFVWKLTSGGVLDWARRAGGTGSDWGLDVAVDAAGNVLVAGSMQGTADFDPGGGTLNLTSAGSDDIFAWKLTSAGDLVWAQRAGGSSADVGYGVAVDSVGKVLVAGYFQGMVDFDPGVGTVNLVSAGSHDAFVWALSSSGNLAWAGRAGGTNAEDAYGIAVDASGNVLITGLFMGTADFDPGLGAFNVSNGGNTDGFVARWNAGQIPPEIQLVGNGQAIASGDATPSLLDYTDFGSRLVASGQAMRTLGILNTGLSVLNLTGAPLIEITGPHAGDFTVTVLPSAAVNGGSTATFQITFDPTAPGLRTATVTIQSDDTDEGTYTFAIQGTGLASFDPAAVSGTVWDDQNSDGQQSGGEPGVRYAVVELFDTVDGVAGNADDVSLGVRVTDAGGNYQFTGLPHPGPYFVVVRPPVGFAFTAQDTGPDATDSDVSGLGQSGAGTLASGQTLDLDAGLTGAAPGFGWAARQGGLSSETSSSVATDSSGYSYVAGDFSGTMSLGPGPAAINLTSQGGTDVFVAKYAPGGALVWGRAVGGTSFEGAGIVTVDAAGNVIVIGNFQGIVDFDPGAGIANLTSAGSQDVFVLKLDAGGNFVWVRGVGGTSTESYGGLAIDAAGNVLVTGSFFGTADFDPGVGTANLTSAGSADAFVLKLDANGNYVWAQRVGGANVDSSGGVAVDASGNALVTGQFEGTVDFDSGAGTANLTSAGSADVFVLKLDAAGNYVWAKRVGGLTSDNSGGVATDAAGNVLVTGQFTGTADFDPGAGVFNLTSAGDYDVFVFKLDAGGNFVWARRVGGTGSDSGFDVAVDAWGNVLAAGVFTATADFDPGAGTLNLTSSGSVDVFVLKLDAAGNYVWAGRAGSTDADYGYGVAVDAGGNVLVSGFFSFTVDFDPGASTFNLTSAGSWEGYLWQLNAALVFPPQVTGVFVRGTGDASGSGNDEWLAAYLTHLGTQGLGDAALGYRVSVGADQLDTLPWTNVDTVSIRFSEGVTVVSGNLQVIGAAEGPAVPSVASFTYNASTFTATWQFATPLPANKYLLYIATGVVVGLDTLALDGEWTDGVSTASGNGAAGGAFSFRMNVVPGDVNGDTATTQSVTNADVLLTKQALSTDTLAGAAYLYRRDVNGSGAVTNADVLQAKQRLSTSIFDYTEPVPPPPGESFGEESFAAARLAEPALLDESAVAPSPRLTEPWHTESSEPIDLEAWDAAILAIYGKKK